MRLGADIWLSQNRKGADLRSAISWPQVCRSQIHECDRGPLANLAAGGPRECAKDLSQGWLEGVVSARRRSVSAVCGGAGWKVWCLRAEGLCRQSVAGL